MNNPFKKYNSYIRDCSTEDVEEVADFPIRSENGNVFKINRFYVEAFKVALDSLNHNGVCDLTLYADDDNPRLMPTDKTEKKNGPEFSFPLGRIVRNAGENEQVERISKEGDYRRDWTFKNTRVTWGKARNRRTRANFLNYLENKIRERHGIEEAKNVRNKVSDLFTVADTFHKVKDESM